jgi:hypothetical protein
VPTWRHGPRGLHFVPGLAVAAAAVLSVARLSARETLLWPPETAEVCQAPIDEVFSGLHGDLLRRSRSQDANSL